MCVALGIQHAMRIRHIVICGFPGSNILSHYLINVTIFEKKKAVKHKMCVLIFSTTLPAKFLILRRTERDMIKNVYWTSCKVPLLFLLDFHET